MALVIFQRRETPKHARAAPHATLGRHVKDEHELELELILSQMAQKPMLRGEVGARALRVRSDVRGHGQVRLCKALDCGKVWVFEAD